MTSFVIGAVLLVIGLSLLSEGWRWSQGQRRPSTLDRDAARSTAAPIGLTGAAVSLLALAVIVSGWDLIGRLAALAALLALAFGLAITAVVYRRANQSAAVQR